MFRSHAVRHTGKMKELWNTSTWESCQHCVNSVHESEIKKNINMHAIVFQVKEITHSNLLLFSRKREQKLKTKLLAVISDTYGNIEIALTLHHEQWSIMEVNETTTMETLHCIYFSFYFVIYVVPLYFITLDKPPLRLQELVKTQ